MNENIDVRMSNYITLLSHPELTISAKFNSKTILAMEKALMIYASTTANKYVDNYQKEQESLKLQQQFNGNVSHDKLEPTEPSFQK